LRNLLDRLRSRLRLHWLAEWLAIAVALAMLAVAVGENLDRTEDVGARPAGAAPPPASAATGAPRAETSFLARIIPPPPERVEGPRVPRSIGDLARRLPPERKVAQLFVWGFEGQDLTAPIFERLLRYDLGGVLLDAENYSDPQQLALMAGEAKAVARNAAHVPPFVAAVQEGAEFNSFPELPPSGAPADYDTPAAAAAAAGESGRLTSITGPKTMSIPSARRLVPDSPAAAAAAAGVS
jgi:hypothetical protein